jgi:hypothetical protein
MSNPVEPDLTSVTKTFTQLLGTIQAELTAQITATETELNQVKSLMDGAIDDLVDSFISLESTTRIGQNLVKQMAASESDVADELNPFRNKQQKSKHLLREASDILNKLIADAKQNQTTSDSLLTIEKISDETVGKILTKLQVSGKALSEKANEVASKVTEVIAENQSTLAMVTDEMTTTTEQIARDVQTAVKSLQFQDMTTQLIAQSIERLKIIRQMLNSFQAISIQNSSSLNISDLQAALINISDEIKRAGQARMKAFNVNAGHIELFD